MRHLWLLALLWTPVQADPIAFTVQPGGGWVADADEGGRILSYGAPGRSASFDVPLDRERPHHLDIVRPPYDALHLTFSWDERIGRWTVEGPSGTRYVSDDERYDLARQVALNVIPDGFEAWLPAPGSATTLTVQGQTVAVTPLPRTSSGLYRIPAAASPPPIYLARPLFGTCTLQFAPGDLDNPAYRLPLQPVRLPPLLGPFSYPSVDTGALVLGASGVLYWGLVGGPRAQRRRAIQRRYQAVQQTIQRALQASSVVADPEGLVGQVVETSSGHRLTLLRVVGKGGFGAVLEATEVGDEKSLGTLWAVKVLLQALNPEQLQRFEAEVRACCKLQHPGVVKVLDWGTSPRPFMVFELLSGQTLRDIYRRGPLPVERAIYYTAEVLKALGSVHRAGLVHRDVKPDNVMVLASGHIKLMDLGIAHDVKRSVTQARSILGTQNYMSPEHFDAPTVVPASDIYSAGVQLYEGLAGRLPYTSSDLLGLITQICLGHTIPLRDVAPEVPEPVARVVARMMATELAERYATVDQVLDALRAGGYVETD